MDAERDDQWKRNSKTKKRLLAVAKQEQKLKPLADGPTSTLMQRVGPARSGPEVGAPRPPSLEKG